jgi:polyvinyl alcohol dehydrogenase (cytochrome)
MLAALAALTHTSQASEVTPAQLGEQLYKKHCAACHDNGIDRAPLVDDLKRLSAHQILLTLEIGRMQPQASAMSKDEKALVAGFLAGEGEQDYSWIEDAMCSDKPETVSDNSTVHVDGWGFDNNNTRLSPYATSGINKANVGKLKLKWAFGFEQVNDMRSQPVYTEDALFVGSRSGHVLALDPKKGCVKWQTRIMGPQRSSLTLGEVDGERALMFSDELANIYALRARDGKQLWKRDAALFPTSLVTGASSYHDGVLFVPISSYEIAAAGMPGFPCCRSHGGVVALDADTGKEVWTWHSTEHAKPTRKTEAGTQLWGPSGAPVWTTPMVDTKRGLIYVGTGENTSKPATDSSDAIFALDIKSGKPVWHFQAIANDVWNAACLNGGEACPEDEGPDFDFGASVILTKDSKGKDVLLAGQKSGEMFALDPDNKGKLLWRNRISLGTTNGGIHWGMTVHKGKVFVPVSDPEREIPGYTPRPGMYALDIDSGKTLWQKSVERGCKFDMQYAPKIGLEQMRSGKKRSLKDRYACSFYYGLSAASTGTPGIVFSGGLDGKLRAYDMDSGEILWQVATAVPYKTVNGLDAHGGAMDSAGPILGNGMLFVNSGYSLFGQLPGNVLLAFEIEDDK